VPEVGEPVVATLRVVTPREDHLIQPTARRSFPLGFARQAATSPVGECLGILVGNMDHWMIVASTDR
jgi:hypothetical protein